MMLFGITGFIFIFGETMIITFGWKPQPELGRQFHRIEQIAATFFIPLLPMLIQKMLILKPTWHKINKILAIILFVFAFLTAVIAFINPELFVSVSQHRANWMKYQADYGRGMECPLYGIRDIVLFVFIAYTIVCYLSDMIMNKTFKRLYVSFAGLLIAVAGGLIDMMSVTTGNFYDFFPEARFSRFVLGITLFILFSMGEVLKLFLSMGKEVQIARDSARREAERSKKQNDFIKNVLESSSNQLARFSESLSEDITDFGQNTQDQAAATEEITVSIEEITAGMDTVSSRADIQFASIEHLNATMLN